MDLLMICWSRLSQQMRTLSLRSSRLETGMRYKLCCRASQTAQLTFFCLRTLIKHVSSNVNGIVGNLYFVDKTLRHYHSLLRQMAAQKQEKHRVKMKNTHNYRRKIKRKTIKSKSEYTKYTRQSEPKRPVVQPHCRVIFFKNFVSVGFLYNFSIAICHLFSLTSTSVIICLFWSYNLLFPWPNMLTSLLCSLRCIEVKMQPVQGQSKPVK